MDGYGALMGTIVKDRQDIALRIKWPVSSGTFSFLRSRNEIYKFTQYLSDAGRLRQ